MSDEIKVGQLLRDCSGVELTVRKVDGMTRLQFSASSEAPVERFFGTEILSHEPGAIRMEGSSAARCRCCSITTPTTRSE